VTIAKFFHLSIIRFFQFNGICIRRPQKHLFDLAGKLIAQGSEQLVFPLSFIRSHGHLYINRKIK